MTDFAELQVGISSKESKKGAREVNRALDSIGRHAKTNVDKADSQFKRMGKSLTSVRGVIAGAGIGVVLGSAFNTTVQFTKAVGELSAITGATGRDLDFLSNKAREFGKTTTKSAVDSATAFKLVASAKPDLLTNVEALAQVTEEVIRLSEAAGVSLPNAASTVGESLNQFSADADQASRFVNVLAAGSKLGSAEVDRLSESLKFVGPVAATVGLSFEETNAALQVLASRALKGGEAGSAMRNVLLKMEADIDKRVKPSTNGLASALKFLQTKELDVTELTKKFGRQNVVAASTLIDMADSVGTLTGALTGTQTALEQQIANVNTLNGDVEGLKSAWEGMLITLGLSQEGGLRSAVQGLTSLIRVLEKVLPLFLEGVIVIAKFGTALLALRLSLKVFSGLATLVVALTSKLRLAHAAGVLLARTLMVFGGPIGAGIALLTGAYLLLTNKTDGAREAQERYNKIMNDGNKITDDAIQSSKSLIVQKAEEQLAIEQLTKALLVEEAQRIQLHASKQGLTPFSTREIERLKKIGTEIGKIDNNIRNIIEKGSRGTRITRVGPTKPDIDLKGMGDSTVSVEMKLEAEQFETRLASLINELDPLTAKTNEYTQSIGDLDRAWIEGKISGERHDELVMRLATDTDALAEAQRQQQAIMDEGQRIWLDTRTEAERLTLEMENLIDLYHKGAFGAVGSAQATDTLNRAIKKVGETTEETTDHMSEFAINAARSMQSAFADFLFDPVDQGLKGMLKNFGETFRRIAAEAASAQIFDLVFQAAGGLATSSNPFLAGVGNIAKSFNRTGATGATVGAGERILVGEEGMELLEPTVPSRVVPIKEKNQGAALGGNKIFHISVNASKDITPKTARQMGIDFGRGIAKAQGGV